jgi:hypothetical protein
MSVKVSISGAARATGESGNWKTETGNWKIEHAVQHSWHCRSEPHLETPSRLFSSFYFQPRPPAFVEIPEGSVGKMLC